jgi:hypothetical protein
VRRFLEVLLFVLFLGLPLTAGAEGRVLPEDFVVRGVTLGETADEAAIAKAFGTPLFDTEKSVFGIRVKYYTFKKKFSVGVSVSTGKVVDIVIEDRDYEARDGVRYGATPHRIAAVYGKNGREQIAGLTWNVYRNPEKPGQKLMIEIEPGTWILVSWRLTSLPLTEEDADLSGGEEDWQSADFNAQVLEGKDIDMSALKDRDETEKGTTPPWKR